MEELIEKLKIKDIRKQDFWQDNIKKQSENILSSEKLWEIINLFKSFNIDNNISYEDFWKTKEEAEKQLEDLLKHKNNQFIIYNFKTDIIIALNEENKKDYDLEEIKKQWKILLLENDEILNKIPARIYRYMTDKEWFYGFRYYIFNLDGEIKWSVWFYGSSWTRTNDYYFKDFFEKNAEKVNIKVSEIYNYLKK